MTPVANLNSWVRVEDYRFPEGWSGDATARAREYCSQLEAGRILFFSGVPFELPPSDREFLIAQKQTESRFHKNISYRPKSDVLRGTSTESTEERGRLHRIMRQYSAAAADFVAKFLAPYADKLRLDFASFRPLEEQGRNLPTHKRNDLLHVDSFPTRPTHGARILRVFTNINPAQPRVWVTGEPFHELAARFAHDAGLPRYAAQAKSALFQWRTQAARAFKKLGLPLAGGSAYDHFMLHFHDWLKFNQEYQASSENKMRWEFPPGCTWLVYTDGVPHAALSGQYALEHTYIVPRAAMVAPELAPVSVLEKLSGVALAG
jgi:3-deoxy-D-manno-octulosonic acid hydroxylase-like protein